MIKHSTHLFVNLQQLEEYLVANEIQTWGMHAQSILVQVFAARFDKSLLSEITSTIRTFLPKAIIVGATTVGEIANGYTLTGEITIGIDFFPSSYLSSLVLDCPTDDEYDIGVALGQKIASHHKVAGVLLLANTLSMNGSKLLKGMASLGFDCPIFGGGAGDYAAMNTSYVFCNGTYFPRGVVAVIFSGLNLHIEVKTYLGWEPLSKRMTVTDAEDMVVKSVDHKPAFEIYERYLNIPNDNHFFLNVLEFPFLIERNGEILARVPVSVGNQGELVFVADVETGDEFRIGYGNPELIVTNALTTHKIIKSCSPQVVLLYSCGCRRFLMQEEVELETLPFESIAPTFGFYTYGEFFGSMKEPRLLNSTMVVVSMREGDGNGSEMANELPQAAPERVEIDPYRNKHTRVISRLLRFITEVTNELEKSNLEITKLSETDKLTQVHNRVKLDQVLSDTFALANRYRMVFSIILIDIDHFKRINDVYGHLIGDQVLTTVAKTLAANIRSTDLLGRWGGEEFLLVVPQDDTENSLLLAEKLRYILADVTYPAIGQVTCSFGVSSYRPSDTIESMLDRADKALYEAKKQGRNRVDKL